MSDERPGLSELKAFATIVAHSSFRKAADELGMSASTLSHLMRTLEARLGVRLLNRTTRSVSATEAGARLVERLSSVLRDLDSALEEVNRFRDRPSGVIRINASEPAARALLERVVPEYLDRYPEMVLDLVTDGRLVDIVAQGFDAGVRLGEAIAQDMISVRIGGDVRFITVAAPGYLEKGPAIRTPDDLGKHQCIRIRMPSGKPYRWEFERHGQELSLEVKGALILDHQLLMVDAAVRGLGVAYVPQVSAQPLINQGLLVAVLEDWCPPIPGLFLYYPGHRHVPAGLRAFIEVLREFGQGPA